MAPVAPSNFNLAALAAPNKKVQATWQNHTPPDYTRLEYERKPAGGSFAVVSYVTPGTAVSYLDSSVEDGKQYTGRVRAYSHTEGYSPYSNEDSAIVPLAAASGLDGVALGATSVRLTWNDNSQNETAFRIYKKVSGAWVQIASVGANVETYDVTSGLVQGTWYEFMVKAYNATAGLSLASNSVMVFTADPPAKPTGLTATAISQTEIVLAWIDNADNETGYKIEESSNGVDFSQIATVGAGVQSYLRSGLSSLDTRWYRVRAYNSYGNSQYSSTASTTTWANIAPPSNLVATPISGTQVDIFLDDNSILEDATCIERQMYSVAKLTDGGLENWASATNLTSWTESVTGSSTVNRESTVVHGGTYSCRIDIDASNSGAYIYQAPALTPGAPARLAFRYRTAPGKTASFRLCNSTAAVSLAMDGTWVASSVHTLPSTNNGWGFVAVNFTVHASYSSYLFLIGGYASGWFSAASSSIYLDDISIGELGAFSEIVQLAPNQTAYRDATGLVAGNAAIYRARAKQGASTYSAYSPEVSTATLTTPTPPAGLAVTEYQDTWARLSWTLTAGETGYKIEQSPDGSSWTEVMVIPARVATMRVPGLTASTLYYWRIRAYNGAGDSAYTSTVSQTTRADYLPSKFEKLLRRTDPGLIFRPRVNPLMRLSGWTLASGRTYTYELAFDELGAALTELLENGSALTLKTSITAVEAAAGSWWHDPLAGKVYLHTTGGLDPANYHIAGGFWLYFTTGPTDWYDGNRYLPLVPIDGIPDVSQEALPFWEGGFTTSSGKVAFLNPFLYGEYFWDRRWERYLWLNRKVIVDAGGADFEHSGFVPILAGTINDKRWGPTRVEFDLRDLRAGVHKNIPEAIYTFDEFPDMDENLEGQLRPHHYGTVVGYRPPKINITDKVFELHRGRIKSVEAVRKNGSALVLNTDYFVDLQRGRVTLARSLTLLDADVIEVDFTGAVTSADEVISNGAEIFLDVHTAWLGLALADMETDSIFETKYARTAALAVSLREATSTQDLCRTIEMSIGAMSYQTNDGRIGLRPVPLVPASNAVHIANARFFDRSAEKGLDNVAYVVNVHYARDPNGEDIKSTVTRTIPQAKWEHGTQKPIDVPTALAAAADAGALADLIVSLLGASQHPFEVDRVLFLCLPGDIAYISADRFPSLSGVAAGVHGRLMKITKAVSSGKSQATADIV